MLLLDYLIICCLINTIINKQQQPNALYVHTNFRIVNMLDM